MGISSFFEWVAECCKLLGWAKVDGAKMMPDYDPCWYGCYDDGMSPEGAVAKYKKTHPQEATPDEQR